MNNDRQDKDLDFILSLSKEEQDEYVENIYKEYVLQFQLEGKGSDNDGRTNNTSTTSGTN